jgi:hypothetical protein
VRRAGLPRRVERDGRHHLGTEVVTGGQIPLLANTASRRCNGRGWLVV